MNIDINKNQIRNITKKNYVKDDKCKKCASKLFLVAHHIDYNSPKNVVTLCQSCHTRLHYIIKKYLDKYKKDSSHTYCITISKETKFLLENDCKKLLVNKKPMYDNVNLSNGFMLKIIVKFYLQ